MKIYLGVEFDGEPTQTWTFDGPQEDFVGLVDKVRWFLDAYRIGRMHATMSRTPNLPAETTNRLPSPVSGTAQVSKPAKRGRTPGSKNKPKDKTVTNGAAPSASH